MGVEKTIEQIPLWDDNKLAKLLRNALERVADPNKKSDALAIIDAVSNEWRTRLLRYKKHQYRATTPEIGVLSFLGYHVGQEGEPRWRRRQILQYILNRPLPPVGSPAYIAEWGNCGSAKRKRKLCNVLRGLSSNRTHQNSEKALIEWLDDLEYIEQIAC